MLWLSTSEEELVAEQAKEVKLREEYKVKLAKAVNLEALKKQREQVQQYVTQLEKQLPSKAEMDACCRISTRPAWGAACSLICSGPGQVVVKDYYAELPIAVQVTGRYHDMGAFASDIANLSRIVTFNNLTIVPGKEGDTWRWTPPPRHSAIWTTMKWPRSARPLRQRGPRNDACA